MAPEKKPATPKPRPKVKANSGSRPKMNDDAWKALRIAWESDPDMSPARLGRENGISENTITSRMRREGWVRMNPNLSGLSSAALTEYQKRKAKLKLPYTEDDLNALADEIAAEFAAKARADLQERHQKEWDAPRALAYQAMREKNFELAKIAKISTESLTNIQNGERKAWGLDKGNGNETNIRVVIERE